ncbi:transglycosylase SLT domain-containing protein [Porphyrobacter algicida]|uniref:Transglycosylase SLT domain-containing protein n=1 Tax=Qipengyuania algicida TaxID=1836209 RepID=A0A845AEM2_9SPHN|nr:lytic transglycosylase domain-containing protein [Qipengyuania algicida]MXP28962.1 transglycosylase SLT domain-containing protein [Qipengyuania algicida]
MKKRTFFAGLLAAIALPVGANASSLSVNYFTRATSAAVPQLLSDSDRTYYTSLFGAIDAKNWDQVEVLLAQRQDGPLQGFALASYFLDASSPKIPLERLTDWLQKYPNLPQAAQIAQLAYKRGLTTFPALPVAQQLQSQPGLTRRSRPPSVNDGTMPADIASQITQKIVSDDPDGARLLLDGVDATLSPQARAEWRQKVAWSYYIENRDAEAYALARTVTDGSGPWVAEGEWVVGLSAWRLDDCRDSAIGFQRAAASTSDPELIAASRYWASRALIRCRKPDEAAKQLRDAARYDETLYGMLALEQLGVHYSGEFRKPDLTSDDWRRLSNDENAREAVMLAELGRTADAETAIKYQARIGNPREFDALARLARALGLAGAQRFMAYNVPRGAKPDPSLRWPIASEAPRGGWRVDPALAFAHALQESSFRPDAVSQANAIGLMQVRPIAAREHAGAINLDARYVDLKDPSTNLALGQQTLQSLADANATGGTLPKVMAAYNAGLSPVTRWNREVNDMGDPLLWMESIPYWETRGYVNIVMRNYWMYLRQAGAPAPSRVTLAENAWPQFPKER